VRPCPDAHFTSTVTSKLAIARNPNLRVPAGNVVHEQSILQDLNYRADPNVELTGPIFGSACYLAQGGLISLLKDKLAKLFNVDVGTLPTDPCPTTALVDFPVEKDRFYGTVIDTDGVFYLAGRSVLMDDPKLLGPRTPVPVCAQ
jgi:hypothetical protein